MKSISAAGGVVVRERDGRTEVLAVHRPRYADWSLPKGKLNPGESEADAARREVLEETGYRCALGRRLPSPPPYVDNRGRHKSVSYWVMSVEGGEFVPNGEVDAIRWCTFDELAELLSYDRDIEVVRSALAEDGPQLG